MAIKDLSIQKREKVSNLIQATRLQKGLSQEELAITVGCSRSTINRIESNAFSPNADQLYAILECLGLTLKIGDQII